ncbi:MAG: hypothetical protein E6Q40_01335 [Cupriavidus sp.]|nr:MAG: hypothetical protein E6Q40_01335 [Cupriavidus sp.]
MKLTNTIRILSVGLILAVSGGVANAKQGTPQTHHCKQQDGSMDMKKTKKQCLAGKGTWAKDADTSATPAAPAAPAPAAAPAAAAAPKS